MPIGLVGCKYGMTRIFTDDGVSIPVTVIHVDSNRVTQVKTVEIDGYRALQITAGSQLPSRINKPLAGHYAKSNVQAGRGLWEFSLEDKEGEEITLGQELKVDLFEVGQKVDIAGTTKGKGFAGTIKRHHFRSQDATHGNSLSHRVPGSVGMNQSPGRVFRGKKMAGQLGNVRRTIQNQEVVRIDNDKNLLFVKGVVPGAIGGYVVIRSSVKSGEK
ncbi:MAG TPA: 50S ribosomal protein L3 [Gammaproteobacteria bacterium]|nr:50S ribosomal protein L3 [Gammaproteobacteria bacterium]